MTLADCNKMQHPGTVLHAKILQFAHFTWQSVQNVKAVQEKCSLPGKKMAAGPKQSTWVPPGRLPITALARNLLHCCEDIWRFSNSLRIFAPKVGHPAHVTSRSEWTCVYVW